MIFLAFFVVIILIIGFFVYQGSPVASKGNGTPTAHSGGHSSTPDATSGTPDPNQYTDISDGLYAFDTDRPDGNYKIQASNYFIFTFRLK